MAVSLCGKPSNFSVKTADEIRHISIHKQMYKQQRWLLRKLAAFCGSSDDDSHAIMAVLGCGLNTVCYLHQLLPQLQPQNTLATNAIW